MKKMNLFSNLRIYGIVICASFSLISFSCDSDDDPNDPINSDDLVGEWSLTYYQSNNVRVDLNGDNDFNVNMLALEFEDCGKDDSYVFTTGSEQSFSRADSTDNGELGCHPDGDFNIVFDYFWNISEDQKFLLVDYDRDGTFDSEWEIVSWSTNEVTFRFEEEEEFKEELDSEIEVGLVSFTSILTRN